MTQRAVFARPYLENALCPTPTLAAVAAAAAGDAPLPDATDADADAFLDAMHLLSLALPSLYSAWRDVLAAAVRSSQELSKPPADLIEQLKQRTVSNTRIKKLLGDLKDGAAGRARYTVHARLLMEVRPATSAAGPPAPPTTPPRP